MAAIASHCDITLYLCDGTVLHGCQDGMDLVVDKNGFIRVWCSEDVKDGCYIIHSNRIASMKLVPVIKE